MEHVALADALGADDAQARDDRAVITEWSETASAMRFRQCPLPPGMRAWFAKKAAELHIPGPLLDEELTEEQMAEAEVEGTETAGHMRGAAGSAAGNASTRPPTWQATDVDSPRESPMSWTRSRPRAAATASPASWRG